MNNLKYKVGDIVVNNNFKINGFYSYYLILKVSLDVGSAWYYTAMELRSGVTEGVLAQTVDRFYVHAEREYEL